MENKQKYELGALVFAFKATKKEDIIVRGIVKTADINSSGYIQYSIVTMDKDGKKVTIYANHASLARTEEEIKQKLLNYKEFEESQKKIYIEKFGDSEFNQDVLEAIGEK